MALVFSLILSLASSAFAYTVPSNTVVYVTPTGECYHLFNCSYIKNSYSSMTITDAEYSGYRACSRCDPDVFTGTYEWSDEESWGSSSGSSHSSSSGSHNPPAPQEDDRISLLEKIFVFAVLFFLSGVWVIPFLIIEGIKDRIQKNKPLALPARPQPSQELLDWWYEQERGHFLSIYGGKDPVEFVTLPTGTTVNQYLLPAKSPMYHGFDPYTVYIASDGTCYHHKRGCSGAYLRRNIVDAQKSRRPCKRCAKAVDLSWYDKYMEIAELKKRYNIDQQEV